MERNYLEEYPAPKVAVYGILFFAFSVIGMNLLTDTALGQKPWFIMLTVVVGVFLAATPWLWKKRWYFFPFEIEYTEANHNGPTSKAARYYSIADAIWFTVRPRNGVELEWIDVRLVEKRGISPRHYIDAPEGVFITDISHEDRKSPSEYTAELDCSGGTILRFNPPIKRTPQDKFWLRAKVLLGDRDFWSGYLSFNCTIGTERRCYSRLPIHIYAPRTSAGGGDGSRG